MLIKRGDAKIVNIVEGEDNIDELLDTKKAFSKVKENVKKDEKDYQLDNTDILEN